MSDRILEETLSAMESDMHDEAGQRFVATILEYLAGASRGSGAVTTSSVPANIQARFAEPLPTGRRPIDQILERIEREVIPDAIKLMHPRYMGVSVAPPLPAAVWTEALIAAMNQSVRAFAMSPTLTPIELQIVRWLADRVGFPASAGGTLTSGGTEANFTALLAARAAIAPDAWENGLGSEPPVVFHGESAHESVIRAVAQLGLGSRRAICVPLKAHRMDTEILASRIRGEMRRGTKIMAVVATAGSSTTGAFDDIDTIGTICKEHALWLHVDGAHGATALLSETHRHHLRGIEHAHSVTWDPHKMMLMPLSASAVLVRNTELLDRAFCANRAAANATADWNLGLRSFMTSRRADALKLWVGLLRYGADGIGAIYDHLCGLTTALHRLLSARGDFAPLHIPHCNLLCFRYIGNLTLEDHTVDLVNRKLHERFNRSARGFIATGNLDGRFALRVTIMNPRTQETHLHELLDELAAMGREVVAEHR